MLSEIKGLADPNEPSTIAGNVPAELDPCSTLLPSSTPAATELNAACAAVGLVTVPKLNEMAAPAEKSPDVKLTVSTRLVPSMLANPAAPDAGDVKASGVLAVQPSPAPDKLIKSLPVDGTKVAGVRVIDMVTPVAP